MGSWAHADSTSHRRCPLMREQRDPGKIHLTSAHLNPKDGFETDVDGGCLPVLLFLPGLIIALILIASLVLVAR